MDTVKRGNENNNEFKKLWHNASDALYEPDKTREILDAFNQAISDLSFISGEEEYFFKVLNTCVPIAKEYKKIASSMGEDLMEISSKLEALRNLLFGDCINWDYICGGLDKVAKEKD